VFGFDLNEFSMKTSFNNFSIIPQNIMKVAWCTPTHQGLSNGTKSMANKVMVWEIST
jgi:hypothetical protein